MEKFLQKIRKSLDSPSISLVAKASIPSQEATLPSPLPNPVSPTVTVVEDEESRRPSLYSSVQANGNVREDEAHQQREHTLMNYIKEQDVMLVAMRGKLHELSVPAQNNINQTRELMFALQNVSDKMQQLQNDCDLLYVQLKQQHNVIKDRDSEIAQLKSEIRQLQLKEFDKISCAVSVRVQQQLNQSADIRQQLINAVQPSSCNVRDFDSLHEATEKMLQGIAIQEQISHDFDVKTLETDIKQQLESIGMTLK